MARVRTQREIFRQIVKRRTDDVYDFLQLAGGWLEDFIPSIEAEFVAKQKEELDRRMKDYLLEHTTISKAEYESAFLKMVEENCGHPLAIGELWDVYDEAEYRARNNGYEYLYDLEDYELAEKYGYHCLYDWYDEESDSYNIVDTWNPYTIDWCQFFASKEDFWDRLRVEAPDEYREADWDLNAIRGVHTFVSTEDVYGWPEWGDKGFLYY